MATAYRSIDTTPREGLKVVKHKNLRHQMGQTLLNNYVPIAKNVIYPMLDRTDVPYIVLGSSSLGTKIKVTEDFLAVRTVTNLTELTIPLDYEQRVMDAILRAGWKKLNVTDWFSITYRLDGAGKFTIPTIEKEELLYMDKGMADQQFMAPIFIPAKFYRSEHGSLVIEGITQNDYGTTIVMKLLRGRDRDIQDLAHIAGADDFAVLLEPPKMSMWGKMLAEKDTGRVKPIAATTINTIRGLMESGKYDRELMRKNIATLEELLRIRDSNGNS